MNRNEMLRELQELDFAIQEAVYIPGHPSTKRSRAELLPLCYRPAPQSGGGQHNPCVCGPLTNRDSRGRRWDWINSPWPWEREG